MPSLTEQDITKMKNNQKKNRAKILKRRKNVEKYAPKTEVRFLNGDTIRLKKSMARKFHEMYPMPEPAAESAPFTSENSLDITSIRPTVTLPGGISKEI